MTSSGGADPAALPPGPMTETEFRSLYERLRGQLPWGPDDRRGALNYITQAEILAALGEVTLGRTVSLAAPVEDRPAADNPDPAQHQMTGPLGADAGPGLAFSMDRIAMNIHGNADSHVDALCHVIFDGELYNGVAADTVTGGRGGRAVHRRRRRRHRRPGGTPGRAAFPRRALAGAW